MTELDYELRDDGVLYRLGDRTAVMVRGNGTNRVRVALQRGDTIVPPETGNLASSALRNRLVGLAEERFGEVNGLAEDLGSIAAMFDEHLRERQAAVEEHGRETNAPGFAGTPYRVEDGGFARIKHTREGETSIPLTNFTAWVEEEVVRDDGLEKTRTYKIAGRAGDRSLPRLDVPVSRFQNMNWVSEHWGLGAHVTAGQHQHAKEAIEYYSRNAATSHRFSHVGWRLLEDGSRVFLHSGGAIV